MNKEEKLGDKLLRYRMLTQEQLDNALAACKATGELLGVVLINQGLITQEALHKIMQMSGKRIRPGEMLVREKAVTADDLETALEIQKLNKQPLGRILIEIGKVTPERYLKALSKHFNMPVKSLAGFVPRIGLDEIVGQKVSLPCNVVVLENTPEAVEVAVAEPYDELLQDPRILVPSKELRVHLAAPDEPEDALAEYSRQVNITTILFH
ncbi:MAG: hypothetical protein ABIF71_08870 [Planctomycetota bacterium]